MDKIIINIEPIMQHIDYICLIVSICVVLIISAFIFSRCYQDKLNNKKDIHNKNKDVEVVTEAFAKIGEVKDGTKNEIILNAQNRENNLEIYAIDKKLLINESEHRKIWEAIKKLTELVENEVNKRG